MWYYCFEFSYEIWSDQNYDQILIPIPNYMRSEGLIFFIGQIKFDFTELPNMAIKISWTIVWKISHAS